MSHCLLQHLHARARSQAIFVGSILSSLLRHRLIPGQTILISISTASSKHTRFVVSHCRVQDFGDLDGDVRCYDRPWLSDIAGSTGATVHGGCDPRDGKCDVVTIP